jgi:hypothetical protein
MMATKTDWREEQLFQSLRGFAANKRRKVNNGQRLKVEAADQQRRTERAAVLDAILAADNDDLDAELARLDAE